MRWYGLVLVLLLVFCVFNLNFAKPPSDNKEEMDAMYKAFCGEKEKETNNWNRHVCMAYRIRKDPATARDEAAKATLKHLMKSKEFEHESEEMFTSWCYRPKHPMQAAMGVDPKDTVAMTPLCKIWDKQHRAKTEL